MPARPASAAAEDPHDADDAVDVDAGSRRRGAGCREIGAGRLADAGAQQPVGDGERARRCEIAMLSDVDPGAARSGRGGCRADAGARQLLRAAADEELEDVAHREREADAHDHELDDARRLVVAAVSRVRRRASSPRRAPSTTASGIASQIGRPRLDAEDERHEGTEGHHLAVREVARARSCRRSSERPIAASASSRPKFRPLTTRSRSWSKNDVVVPLALAEEEVHDLRVGRARTRPPAWRSRPRRRRRPRAGSPRRGSTVYVALLGNADAPLAVRHPSRSRPRSRRRRPITVTSVERLVRRT